MKIESLINEILSDCKQEGLTQEESIKILSDALNLMITQVKNDNKDLRRELLINAMKYKQLKKEFVKLLTSKIYAGTKISLNVKDEKIAEEITKTMKETTLSKNYKILLEKYSKLEQENIKIKRKLYSKNNFDARKDV